MRNKEVLILILFFSIFSNKTFLAQEPSKLDFNGYLSAMPSVFLLGDNLFWQNSIHNRLNFKHYTTQSITFSAELRNQLISGDFIKEADVDNGFSEGDKLLPLTYLHKFSNNNLLSLSVDRFWAMYVNDKLEVTVGRQRINWGKTFAWNPNDLFNTYDFFEIDYPERPGTDAVRVQYYTGYASNIDIVVKSDDSGNLSGATCFKFNKWNYDFQILAGYWQKEREKIIGNNTLSYKDEDVVSGLGFSGAIGIVSTRGELSYFHSAVGADSNNILNLSLGIDIMFKNESSMMLEGLFVSDATAGQVSGLVNVKSNQQDVKSLSFARYNIFAQYSYPISPIINVSIAGMGFLDSTFKGFYTCPSAEFGLANNLYLNAIYQLFIFEKTRQLPFSSFSIGYLRLKWNF